MQSPAWAEFPPGIAPDRDPQMTDARYPRDLTGCDRNPPHDPCAGFGVRYAEGPRSPKMLSVGMHCRLLGRPGRMKLLQGVLGYVDRHDRVGICRRIDIARHWKATHPHPWSTP